MKQYVLRQRDNGNTWCLYGRACFSNILEEGKCYGDVSMGECKARREYLIDLGMDHIHPLKMFRQGWYQICNVMNTILAGYDRLRRLKWKIGRRVNTVITQQFNNSQQFKKALVRPE